MGKKYIQRNILYCFLLVLRRKYGWGKKRIFRALNEMAAIINDLEEEKIDIMDLKREAEEAGMTITINANREIIKVGIFEDKECDMDGGKF